MKTLYILLLTICFSFTGALAQTDSDCVTGNQVPSNVIYKVNGQIVPGLHGYVKEGNFVQVTFTTTGTEPTRFSLVAYNATGATYSQSSAVSNDVFDYESQELVAGVHTLSISVPNNYFQVDFVKGCVIWKFGPTSTDNYYEKQSRLLQRATGGKKDCCVKCVHNQPVTICFVPTGNPANQETMTITRQAAKNRINRHPLSYYGECKTEDTANVVEVTVDCYSVSATSAITKIKFITFLLDDSSTQTIEINAKTAYVSPINEYEGYLVRGAWVKVGKDGTGQEGTFYANATYEECEELIDPALPVKLVKFEAKKVDQHVVKLEWATASESNNDFIAIEKSSDIESWKEVCRVPSSAPNGNSQSLRDYSCFDNNADEFGENIVYYRPKQVDINGAYEYHNTIRVRLMDAAYATDVQSVYPNPATDRLNIRYNAAENGIMNIRLVSIDGKAMLQSQFIAKAGVQTLDLDLMEDKLKPGLYVLEVQSESGIFRQKVYKQ